MADAKTARRPVDRSTNLVWILLTVLGAAFFLGIVTVVTTTHGGGAWWVLLVIPVALWAVSGVVARRTLRRPYEFEPVPEADDSLT